MSLQFQATRPSRPSTATPLLVIALFGLVPFGLSASFMLMQILGIWNY